MDSIFLFLNISIRKFSDIGSTVQNQYAGGLFRICDWAHLVTVHPVPGYGVIEGLKDVSILSACLVVSLGVMFSIYINLSWMPKILNIKVKHPPYLLHFLSGEL